MKVARIKYKNDVAVVKSNLAGAVQWKSFCIVVVIRMIFSSSRTTG